MQNKNKQNHKDQERKRKEYVRGNGTTQKMTSFRLDADLLDCLQKVENKGRLINNLLRSYFEKAPE